MEEHHIPQAVQIRNAHVHNLKNIDVDIPLRTRSWALRACPAPRKFLAGTGRAVCEAPGYLDALSTHTRRRMTQAARAGVDEVLYCSGCAGSHQRPGVPGIRVAPLAPTELLNSLTPVWSATAAPMGIILAPSLRWRLGKSCSA